MDQLAGAGAPMPPGAPPDMSAAMGRFPAGGKAGSPPPPGAEARRAFMEAQSQGAPDPMGAAKQAWVAAVKAIAQRMDDPNFQPADAGEANLKKVVDHLKQTRQMDTETAVGLALEFLAELASGGSATPEGESPVGGAVMPPGGATPPPSPAPPMG